MKSKTVLFTKESRLERKQRGQLWKDGGEEREDAGAPWGKRASKLFRRWCIPGPNRSSSISTSFVTTTFSTLRNRDAMALFKRTSLREENEREIKCLVGQMSSEYVPVGR